MVSSSLFALDGPVDEGKLAPRTGRITIDRGDGTTVLQTDTPALLAASSRGIVPHLSRDAVRLTTAIQHIQLPFESFLDRTPPAPTLVGGRHPLHSYLGYDLERHIITMTARDPADGRKMPPNGNDFVSTQCNRGVRKLYSSTWKELAQKCKPDLVVALSDTPFTPPPHSQKRLTKSIERSISWLTDFLREPEISSKVLVPLAGGTIPEARAEFSDRLVEPIEEKDAASLAPLRTLDEGVAGYVIDLLPIHATFAAESIRGVTVEGPVNDLLHISDRQRSSPQASARITELLHASLTPLPADKPRIVNCPVSPHEILRLVRDVGVDLIDSAWAQRAADIGIALDFAFPIPAEPPSLNGSCSPPRTRAGNKLDLGHNLFDPLYTHDHTRLASSFLDAQTATQPAGIPLCPCGACSPRAPPSRVLHSSVDPQAWAEVPAGAAQPPFTRSYVHHLLHTHEMSSHALLAMHNLHVFAALLAGVRAVLLAGGQNALTREVARFEEAYDEDMALWAETERMWLEVERARGKGRLAREKEKQAAATVGTAVDL